MLLALLLLSAASFTGDIWSDTFCYGHVHCRASLSRKVYKSTLCVALYKLCPPQFEYNPFSRDSAQAHFNSTQGLNGLNHLRRYTLRGNPPT